MQGLKRRGSGDGANGTTEVGPDTGLRPVRLTSCPDTGFRPATLIQAVACPTKRVCPVLKWSVRFREEKEVLVFMQVRLQLSSRLPGGQYDSGVSESNLSEQKNRTDHKQRFGT